MGYHAIEERVLDAFPVEMSESIREEALDYIGNVRDSLKEKAASLNRTVLQLLVLIVLFELLATSAVNQVNVAGFFFRDLAVVYKCLPVLASYVFYEVVVFAVRYSELLQLHLYVVARVQPSISRNDLEVPLLPAMRAIFPMEQEKLEENSTRADKWVNNSAVVLGSVALLLPLLFEVHAYYLLFLSNGAGDLLVWITLALSSAVLLTSYTILYKALLASK